MWYLEKRNAKEDSRMIEDLQPEINYEINKQINIILKKLIELQDRVKRLER